MPDEVFARRRSTRSLEHARERLARRHLGTLGGGNHFLELDRDLEGGLWLLVHSGSRGLGAAVAARRAKVASADDLAGLIPGSMGTASYVVEGLGNEESFGSCSHGAGRVMSRKEPRSAMRPEALRRAMRRIVFPEHRIRHLVEEAPSACRDIGEVLEDQEDLVRRRVRLEPVAVLEG